MTESVYFLDNMICFVDGASNPHIKKSGIGIAWFYPNQLIYSDKGESLKFNEKPCATYAEEIISQRKSVEYPTNNEAEYQSLLTAITLAIESDCKKITVFMDSKLVVNQVNDKWNINHAHLLNYKNKIDKLKQKIKLNLFHIRREHNTWADYQSKLAIGKTSNFEDNKFKI